MCVLLNLKKPFRHRPAVTEPQPTINFFIENLMNAVHGLPVVALDSHLALTTGSNATNKLTSGGTP